MRFKRLNQLLPYDLLHRQKWINQTRNEELQKFLENMVNDQIIKGYSFAYSQLLEAIQEKDETYLSHIAENHPLQLQNPSSKIEVSIDKVNIIFGVLIDRQSNPLEIRLSRQTQHKTFFNVLVYFHNQFSIFNIKTPIMQVDVLFRSKRKLTLKTEDNQDSIQKDSTENNAQQEMSDDDSDREVTHRVTFETQQAGYLSFFALCKACYQNTLWKQFIAGDNCDWVITDIDHSLKGNPFEFQDYQ